MAMPHGGKPPMGDLKKKNEVFDLLYANWQPQTEYEEIPVYEAAGRICAEDLYAKYNQPVVRASRMDGVAVASERFEGGMPDTSGWKLGVDYVRADTGDDFEDAYDAVVQIEKVQILPDGGLKFADDVEIKKGMNVAPCGNNIKEGMQVAKAGTRLKAQDLALLVTGGYDTVKTAKKPVISFIPTGSELVPAGSILERGENFDSNSIMVKTLLTEMGADVRLHPIVKDDKAAIAQALEEMLPGSDIVILNAGTSKGGEDFCVQYLKKKGNMLFHGAAAVPGRPLSITILEGKPVVNMSGPSFAAYYTSHWLIKPMIDKMTGAESSGLGEKIEVTLAEDLEMPPFLSMIAGFRLSAAEDGTLSARRINSRGPGAEPMSASLEADAFYVSSYGEKGHKAGEKIEVYLA